MRENSTWIPVNSVGHVFWEQVPVEAHTGLRVQLCHLGFTPESSPSVFHCQNSPKQPKPTLPHHSTGRAGPPRDTIQTLQNYYVHVTVGNRDPKGQNDQRVEAMQREEELTRVFCHHRSKKSSFSAPYVPVPGVLGQSSTAQHSQTLPNMFVQVLNGTGQFKFCLPLTAKQSHQSQGPGFLTFSCRPV